MVTYELAHVGINAKDKEEALQIATAFSDLFNLGVRPGVSSTFAGRAVEVMNTPYLGERGHIGFATPDVTAAVEDLKSRGYEVDMSTAKYTDGVMTAVYFKQQIAGFAVHIMRKA